MMDFGFGFIHKKDYKDWFVNENRFTVHVEMDISCGVCYKGMVCYQVYRADIQ